MTRATFTADVAIATHTIESCRVMSLSRTQLKSHMNLVLVALFVSAVRNANAAIPAPVYPPTANSDGSIVFSINPRFGATGYTDSGSIFAGTGTWTSYVDMPYPLSDHGVASVNTTAYVFGGLTRVGSAAKVLSSLVAYDTVAELYENKSDIPEPRFRFAYAELDGNVYVIGGLTSYLYDIYTLSSRTLVYNIKNDKWSALSSSPRSPRTDACAAAVNGKLYIAGGWGAGYQILNSVEEYDPATRRWRYVGNMTEARGDCRAVGIDGKLYILGGSRIIDGCTEGMCTQFLSVVEVYEPGNNTWSLAAPMITPRGDFAVALLPGGRLVVAGGETTLGYRNQVALRLVEEYSVANNVWVAKAPMNQGRFRFDGAAVGNDLFTFGGQRSCLHPEDCLKMSTSDVSAFYDVPRSNVFMFVKKDEL